MEAICALRMTKAKKQTRWKQEINSKLGVDDRLKKIGNSKTLKLILKQKEARTKKKKKKKKRKQNK